MNADYLGTSLYYFWVLPWLDATASILADMRMTCEVDSPLHPACASVVSAGQLDKIKSLGYRM